MTVRQLKKAMLGPSAEIKIVTPAMARELRDTCHFGRQRAIYKSNVDYLAAEMREGRFIPGTPILLAVLPNNHRFLLNGNHTLEAVFSTGLDVPLTFIYVPCQDIEEAGRIYGRIDQQRRRSWRDAARAAGVTEPKFINTRWLTAYGNATTVIINRFGHDQRRSPSTPPGSNSRTSMSVKLDLAQFYMPFLEALVACVPEGEIDGANARLIQRGPVVAVALETLRYSYPQAQVFWSGLLADDGLVKSDPRKTLLEYLRENRGGKSHTGIGRIMLMRACAGAWNAFRRGDELRALHPGRTIKFILSDTPWGKTDDDDAVIEELIATAAGSKPVAQQEL